MEIDLKAADEFIQRIVQVSHLDNKELTDLTVLAQLQLGFTGKELDGKYGPATTAKAWAKVRQPTSPAAPLVLPPAADIRSTADQRVYKLDGSGGVLYTRAGSLRRPPREVTGICLHQTACRLGERPERWRGVGAHWGVTRAGQIIRIHDEEKYVVAANGWNNRCVSIEVDGLYAGIKGDLKTVWDDPSTPQRELPDVLSPESAEALRMVVRDIKARFPSVEFLVAHRQASMSRRSDPGQEIWAVALELMKELGLNDGGPGFEIGGYPIPKEWDPTRADKY